MSAHLMSESAPAREGQQVPLGDVLEFMRVLWAVAHGLDSTSKRMRSKLGLTGPQRLVVRLTGRFPSISASQLAYILHMHPSTLTGVLKRLVNQGYLERRVDPLDKRRALFSLTEAGRALDVPSTGTVEAAVERVRSRMPQGPLESARDVLTALAEELGVGSAPLAIRPGMRERPGYDKPPCW